MKVGSARFASTYILGVLTYTIAWKRHWGGDEILRSGFEIEYTYVGIQ